MQLDAGKHNFNHGFITSSLTFKILAVPDSVHAFVDTRGMKIRRLAKERGWFDEAKGCNPRMMKHLARTKTQQTKNKKSKSGDKRQTMFPILSHCFDQ